MFSKLCHDVVQEVGKGTLMPSPSIDVSQQLIPLNVVTMNKKRKFIFFYYGKTYTSYDIALNDLLTDKHVLEVQTETSNCCTFNHSEGNSSLDVKITANELRLECSSDTEVTLKIGQLHRKQISYARFISALKGRYHTIKYF